MTSNGDEARPGVEPGAGSPLSSMFAALYGELAPHPWRRTGSGDTEEPYFLFHDRSLAMGWLDESDESARLGTARWQMNDAGWTHPRSATNHADLVAWFQISVNPVSGHQPLPAQPFLRCAGDVAAQIGTLRLRSLQMLLPVQGLDAAARPDYELMPSLRAADWFTECNPQSRTSVRVTLDSGQSPSIPSATAQMREELSRIEQDVFTCESFSLNNHYPLPMDPLFDDSFWNGPPRYRATLHGSLAEWSLDALGWLAGFLADLCVRHGINTPLVLTATRSETAESY